MSTGPQGKQGARGAQGAQGDPHFGALALVLLIVVSGFSLLAFGVHKADQAARQARHALCSVYVGDLQRIQSNMHLLATHPQGVPALSLTRTALLERIASYKAQARDVNPGDCVVPDEYKGVVAK